ncbi:DMT family transporter [Sporolactobacillus sp. THM7-4]|nr:DMT family transporter [Sporolactobacillus sp. THM7-4]
MDNWNEVTGVHRQVYYYSLLLFAVAAISTSAIFVKLSSAPAPIIAFYRMAFSALILLPFIFMGKSLNELRLMPWKQWLWSILSGIFLAVHYILWFESLRFTSIASSTVIVTLQPIFAFIGGYFLYAERLSILAVCGGLMSILGSFIIGFGDFQIGGMALFGDILAFIAAMMITIYFLIGQHVRKTISLVPYAFIGYASSSLFLVIYSLAVRVPFTGYPAKDWVWFFSLAFVSTILGHSIFNWLIKWLNTSTISMSILGEPVGTYIFAFFIFGDRLTPAQIIGSGIILIGIYVFLKFNKRLPIDPVKVEKFTG